jgi:phosphatidylglycerophosphate synthase
VRAVLRCDSQDGVTDWVAILSIRIAGLSLLERHLLAFRAAGLNEVLIRIASPDDGLRKLVERVTPKGVQVGFAREEDGEAKLEVRADTLADPKLIRSLVSLYSAQPGELVCTDIYAGNYASADKSPYRVRAAGPEELRDAGEPCYPIGVAIRLLDGAESQTARNLAIGRHYWHRLADQRDVPEATRKVFLSTLKATDGVYARTNRRVSIPISRLLVLTPITPNGVTLVALCCSLGAAWIYSLGTYWTMVAGSLGSWFASMLDGCDGEVARVKFQATEFGAWFEMVCDYLYYVAMFLGMGIGIARYTGNPVWNWVGAGSVLGTLLSFVLIARLKKRYARQASSADFGHAFQSKVGSRRSNPIHFFSRHVGFLLTRAALPYFIVIFTVLNIAPWCMGMILLGANLAWSLTLFAYPLFRPAPAGDRFSAG